MANKRNKIKEYFTIIGTYTSVRRLEANKTKDQQIAIHEISLAFSVCLSITVLDYQITVI